jgi:polyisoprenoid-binding protein YceI
MPTWILDPDHSVAAFAVRYLMLTKVRGQFNKMKGAIKFDPPDTGGLSVEVEIDATSIWTGVQKRDEHLRTADFFEVNKYPKILFKSTKVARGRGGECTVTGDLTMRGVTRPVTFKGEYSGPVNLPEFLGGERCIGFTGSLEVNREDFGLMWGSEALGEGGILLNKDVEIFIDVAADRAED